MVDGVASAALLVFGALKYSPTDPSAGFPQILRSIFFLLLLASALAAIAGVHTLQRERHGWWGAAASLIAFVGGTLLFLAILANTPNTPELGRLLPEWLRSVGAVGRLGVGGAADIALTVGVLAATVGVLALGIATIAGRVLPWWCGALIILGSPPAALLFILPYSLGSLLGLLLRSLGIFPLAAPVGVAWLGIAWALVGYVLFRRAGDRLSTPDA